MLTTDSSFKIIYINIRGGKYTVTVECCRVQVIDCRNNT